MLDTCKFLFFVQPFFLRMAPSEMPLRQGTANSSPGLENPTVLQQNYPSLLDAQGCSSSAGTTLCSGLRAEPRGKSHLSTNLSTCPPLTRGKATSRKKQNRKPSTSAWKGTVTSTSAIGWLASYHAAPQKILS